MADNFLTRKIGPAPVWVYIGGTAGVGTFLYIRHKQNAAAAAAAAGTDTTSADTTTPADATQPAYLDSGAGGGGYYGGGGTSGYPVDTGSGSGTGDGSTPVDGTGNVQPPPSTPTGSEPTGSLSLAQLQAELTAAQKVEASTKKTLTATDAAWAKVKRKVPSPQYKAYRAAIAAHNNAIGRVAELKAQIAKLKAGS